MSERFLHERSVLCFFREIPSMLPIVVSYFSDELKFLIALDASNDLLIV